jgi:hypothetical protein
VKLAEKHCKQMMEMIYKKKMAYFESGGDEDWKGRNYFTRTIFQTKN